MSSTVTDGTTTITPLGVKGYKATQPSKSVFHDVIGRSDDDVTLRAPGLREGTLTMYFSTWAEAEAARVLHNAAALFTFSDDDVTSARMTYGTSGSINVSLDEDSLNWVLSVDFREVNAQ